MELSILINHFDIPGNLVLINPIGSGNVNDTYMAVFRNTFEEHRVILQHLNRKVFSDPGAIMRNLRTLTDHAHPKLERECLTNDRVWQLPKIIKTKEGNDFLVDEHGCVWRVITCIPSATAYDQPQGTEHALECGSVLGRFHNLISDMDIDSMTEPIPDFHVTPSYLAKYEATLESDENAMRKITSSSEARRMAMFIEQRKDFAATLQAALERGELKKRMMHGDPKINNIMIDDFTGKGTAMIDLDTVGPGLVHYDFGDALRSICNRAGEEESNLSKVVFNMDLCEAFCKGYLRYAKDFLTNTDLAYLYDSIRLITFELGLRFFHDYLNGNVYFKTSHPEQNLNRARVQFRLCESIESKERMIRAALKNI